VKKTTNKTNGRKDHATIGLFKQFCKEYETFNENTADQIVVDEILNNVGLVYRTKKRIKKEMNSFFD